MIIIPLSLALEGLCTDFVGATTFISLAAMTDISSSALEEEEVSLTSLNNLLLLNLLSSETKERLLSCLFFFLSSSEGLDLTFGEELASSLGHTFSLLSSFSSSLPSQDLEVSSPWQ